MARARYRTSLRSRSILRSSLVSARSYGIKCHQAQVLKCSRKHLLKPTFVFVGWLRNSHSIQIDTIFLEQWPAQHRDLRKGSPATARGAISSTSTSAVGRLSP